MIDFQEKTGLKVIKDLVSGDMNLSRIYGFILYTERDDDVIEALNRQSFWNALDYISGDNWPIFAVRPLLPGQWKLSGGGGRNSMSLMVSEYVEPESNKSILEEFNIKDGSKLPLFVAFMWDNEDKINQIAVPIDNHDELSVRRSLKAIVNTITEVEKRIEPKYKQTEAVFREVKQALEAQQFETKFRTFAKTVVKGLVGFIGLYSSVSGLV